MSVNAPEEENPLTDPTAVGPNSSAFLPYAVSTLSPRIVPNDLTHFKSRGVSKVQKDTAQRLAELKAQYETILDDFHWNKLVYESEFGFEPVIGEVYHLYWKDAGRSGMTLSMVEPGQWPKKHVATLQLGFDGRWLVQEVAQDFDLRDTLERWHRSAADADDTASGD